MRSSSRLPLAALVTLVASGGAASLGACAERGGAASDDAGVELSDAGLTSAEADDVPPETPEDAGRGEPVSIGATAQTSVLDGPWWPETAGKGTKRLGYLRHGAVVVAYTRTFANDDCKDGWFELVDGGFVCGKAATTDLSSPRVRLAPKQPDRDAGLPYRYGVNLTDGTPLYRRVLGAEDRKKHEPWLGPKDKADGDKGERGDKTAKSDKGSKAEGAEGAGEAEVGAAAAEPSGDKPSGESAASEPAGSAPSEAPPSEAPPPKKAEVEDAGAPPSRPTLKELKGRGVLVRRMARGFYLALDKEFKAAGARWWRTSFGFAVPHERIMVQTSRTKHVGTWFGDWPGFAEAAAGDGDGGVALDGADASGGAVGASASPWVVGFVNVSFARKITLREEQGKDGKDTVKVAWGEELPRRAAVMLTGRELVASGQRYHETTGGFWVRMADLTLAQPTPPADLAPGEKWVDVDLTRQALVAFEGLKPIFGTLISSGRRNPQDKEKDFPTPTGTFYVREKHVTTTMDGDVASDGPYSIEDVPWVMYFQGSYATHGAFWHDAFGRVRSHGCVNMTPEDARTLFAWSDPPLPVGWHGVFAKEEKAGTRIVVHEDRSERRRR